MNKEPDKAKGSKHFGSGGADLKGKMAAHLKRHLPGVLDKLSKEDKFGIFEDPVPEDVPGCATLTDPTTISFARVGTWT